MITTLSTIPNAIIITFFLTTYIFFTDFKPKFNKLEIVKCSPLVRSTLSQPHLTTRFDDRRCPVCARVFFNRQSLNRHFKGVHTRVRDHQCPYCSYSCSYKGNLKGHIRNKHPKYFQMRSD